MTLFTWIFVHDRWVCVICNLLCDFQTGRISVSFYFFIFRKHSWGPHLKNIMQQIFQYPTLSLYKCAIRLKRGSSTYIPHVQDCTDDAQLNFFVYYDSINPPGISQRSKEDNQGFCYATCAEGDLVTQRSMHSLKENNLRSAQLSLDTEMCDLTC